MGGYGSGRRGYRLVADYTVKLDSYNLQRKGILSTRTSGFVYHPLSWVNTSTGESDYSIGLWVNYDSDQMTLDYRCKAGEKNIKSTKLFRYIGRKRTLEVLDFFFSVAAVIKERQSSTYQMEASTSGAVPATISPI